ncbi:MAG: sugar ABC transporter permease [Jatrophihabitantaceae bacterium]
MTDTLETVETAARVQPTRRRSSALRRGEGFAGWLFVSPALAILILFLVVPILLALYVSFTNWDGLSNPLSGGAKWVGLSNYTNLLGKDSLTRLNFATALRNNFYFVIFVVPGQTLLALGMAILVNNKWLRGKGFFRTAFYFPSITSSIAIVLVFIFLFQGDGAVNRLLSFIGIHGPNWLIGTNGVFHNILGLVGVHSAPGWAQHQVFSLSIWDWLAGPSIGMCVVIILCTWTTSGTFMLMFLAALQNISEDVDEASELDGASPWQRFRFVTLPMLRPTLLLVLTLGLISTWQVFDQIYLLGPTNQTVSTPAFLSYEVSFRDSAFGTGAAIAFLLFLLIVVLTVLQRKFLPEDIES